MVQCKARLEVTFPKAKSYELHLRTRNPNKATKLTDIHTAHFKFPKSLTPLRGSRSVF